MARITATKEEDGTITVFVGDVAVAYIRDRPDHLEVVTNGGFEVTATERIAAPQ